MDDADGEGEGGLGGQDGTDGDSCAATQASEGQEGSQTNAAELQSGHLALDTFYAATVDWMARADALRSEVDGALDSLRVMLGLSADASVATIHVAVEDRFAAYTTSGMSWEKAGTDCSVPLGPVESRATACQPSLVPELPGPSHDAIISCAGRCALDPSVYCGGQAWCASELDTCAGTCNGSCSVTFESPQTCDGICSGECSGTLQVGGRCLGECTGPCELRGTEARTCAGTCTGECLVQTEGEFCSSGETFCFPSGGSWVQCHSDCFGEITVSGAVPLCEAVAIAESAVHYECTGTEYWTFHTWAEGVSAEEKSDFLALLTELKAIAGTLEENRREQLFLLGTSTDLTGDGYLAASEAIAADEALAPYTCAIERLRADIFAQSEEIHASQEIIEGLFD